MVELRAEDVKEALDKLGDVFGADVPAIVTVKAAARAWLTPDYEAAANTLANIAYNRRWGDEHPNDLLKAVKPIVDAALGFHPGDKGDER